MSGMKDGVNDLKVLESNILSKLKASEDEVFDKTCIKLNLSHLEQLNKNLKDKVNDYREAFEKRTSEFENLILSDRDLKEEINPTCKLQEIKKNEKEVEEEISQLKENIRLKEEYLKSLKAKRSSEKSVTRETVPKLRKEYEFLAKTFPVKWDSTADQNFVKGYILRKSCSEVVPFCLDKEKNSQHFITNFLWGQIEDPHAFAEQQKTQSFEQ